MVVKQELPAIKRRNTILDIKILISQIETIRRSVRKYRRSLNPVPGTMTETIKKRRENTIKSEEPLRQTWEG